MERDRRADELLFQVLTEREETNAAYNESFSGWTKTFTDPPLRRDRRPADLRRQHHRDRNRLLSTGSRPSAARAAR